jgi:cation diffusion facilitator CzcD-associated flavoprotein CzcO/acetyl esterase/lipase
MAEPELEQPDVDVAVVGAGFAGMYLLHRLRHLGFSTTVFETGDDVGGTWFWNRYPGARCDIESIDYSYSFDPELEASWAWSEKYASQPEILRYAQHVAERHDLRRDIRFSTRIVDEQRMWWRLRTSTGDDVTCRHYVMATGCLSAPKEVDIIGSDRFAGPTYWTSRWPHQGVDFTGMRVAVIGTGSSAIQSIPIIAKQAAQLTVFQRTPNFSIPAHNGSVRVDKRANYEQDRQAYRQAARESGAGVPVVPSEISVHTVSDHERAATYEAAWQRGGIIEFLGTFTDHGATVEANDYLAEFVRNKIRETVTDPETAETLCPKDYPIGTKRLCVDTGYYETFNMAHVRLIDLRKQPITTINEHGIEIGASSGAGTPESLEFDAIVFATGFDAMTGAIVNVDITGRNGKTLKEAWSAGPVTYLGLMSAGFPNFFMVTGPGSPSVLSNMIVSIEQHVGWIAQCIADMRTDQLLSIEPTETAVDGWVQHVNDFAAITLMPKANSWYMGANVPGKPRVFLPYPGGVDRYRLACEEVVRNDYFGFRRLSPNSERVNDGVLRRLQPDVMIMLDVMEAMDLPPLESMTPDDARGFMTASAAMSPPGPRVGETVDGVLPGPAGDLAYRLHRPATPGPHPIVVYFHGGGWVLGSATSDDAFCRDLCVRSEAIVVSVDYRHAPEARFPAASDDAFAAVVWVAQHAEALGGTSDQVAVAGWSAGANLAAVVCQQAHHAGGPEIVGQLLLTPVTDANTNTASYVENGEGRVLTAGLMKWFWDHYADPDQRTDPRASPLRAASLVGLPPALVITGEFDPLRDEGIAYAAALADAGVPVQHILGRGHIHTSFTAVDVLPSGVPYREAMATSVRGWFARSNASVGL